MAQVGAGLGPQVGPVAGLARLPDPVAAAAHAAPQVQVAALAAGQGPALESQVRTGLAAQVLPVAVLAGVQDSVAAGRVITHGVATARGEERKQEHERRPGRERDQASPGEAPGCW